MGQNTLNNTKYTKEIVEKVLAHLRDSKPIKYACALAGISYQTLYNWIENAEKGEPGFEGFDLRVSEARSEGILKMEAEVLKLCKHDKKPDARTMHKLLVSRDKELYGEHQNVELSGTVKSEISLEQLVDKIQEAKDDGKE
jgi:hypothetical protein